MSAAGPSELDRVPAPIPIRGTVTVDDPRTERATVEGLCMGSPHRVESGKTSVYALRTLLRYSHIHVYHVEEGSQGSVWRARFWDVTDEGRVDEDLDEG